MYRKYRFFVLLGEPLWSHWLVTCSAPNTTCVRLTLRLRLTLCAPHLRPTYVPHITQGVAYIMVYLQEVPGRWWADPVVFCSDCKW